MPTSSMDKRDRTRLLDMLDMARAVQEITQGQSQESINNDKVREMALERAVELIGEAASKVSPELRQQTPQIPWVDIIAMRNRLIHAYRNINLDIVWSTATTSIPELTPELEKLLSDD